MNSNENKHSYTEEEHSTWRHFYNAAFEVWNRHEKFIYQYHLDSMKVLEKYADHIPSIAEINELLNPIGWVAIYVDGLAPSWEIARMLDRCVMPISRQIRSPQEIFFAHGPDLIHDIFGHLPFILNPECRKLLKTWSSPASYVDIRDIDYISYYLNRLLVKSRNKMEDKLIAHLKQAEASIKEMIAFGQSPNLIVSNFYFWIFEFGIIEHHNQLKIVGSGILSSLDEIEKIASGSIAVKKLSLDSILSHYNISSLQDGYLVAAEIQNFSDLLEHMVDYINLIQDKHYLI
ncbi:phenylalanine-4-hydroxylase [Gammaproteobacteria bacterium]